MLTGLLSVQYQFGSFGGFPIFDETDETGETDLLSRWGKSVMYTVYV